MTKAFEKHLSSEVARIAKREAISKNSAFLFWCASTIFELGDDDAREAISVEGANDKGIDLFWVDDDEGRVIIAQGKYTPDLAFRPKIGQITKLESSLNWLVNPEALTREGKPELAQAAEDYLHATQDGYGVELWFLYTGPKCSNIEKHIGVFNQNPEHLQKRRAMRHYHLEMLRANWEELEGSTHRIETEEVALRAGEGLPFEGPFGKAYVATVPAEELVRLYEKYEEKLFDRNVRLFLGVRKGSVNAAVAETLNDDGERGNFWAYNNGLTFVCDDFTPGQASVALKNFSIVNGCQTAVSLALAGC
jgi:AIPR protein